MKAVGTIPLFLVAMAMLFAAYKLGPGGAFAWVRAGITLLVAAHAVTTRTATGLTIAALASGFWLLQLWWVLQFLGAAASAL